MPSDTAKCLYRRLANDGLLLGVIDERNYFKDCLNGCKPNTCTRAIYVNSEDYEDIRARVTSARDHNQVNPSASEIRRRIDQALNDFPEVPSELSRRKDALLEDIYKERREQGRRRLDHLRGDLPIQDAIDETGDSLLMLRR